MNRPTNRASSLESNLWHPASLNTIAVRAAEELHEQSPRHDAFAVDLHGLCSMLGVRLIETTLPAHIDGFYYRRTYPFIVINTAGYKPLGRRRWTLAHEIGHYELLKRLECPVPCYFHSNLLPKTPLEAACDKFAAQLLLPKEMVLPVWHNLRVHSKPSVVPAMARLFLVTNSAMYTRLSELGLIRR